MQVNEEHQNNPVADPVDALVAVTRPIFAAVLAGVSKESLDMWGKDRLEVPLGGLADVRTASDGETGVSFEYAVHSAVLDKNQIVMERITDALKQCNIVADDASSILFAVEKHRQAQLLKTQRELITDESSVLSGKAGRPVKLKGQLNKLEAAFNRKNTTKGGLPHSISGLWKADLFLGDSTPDRWVGTTVKSNPKSLEGALGLRVAIIPSRADASDAIYKDEDRNLIVCPLPHDQSFVQTFYEGRRVVQALLASKFKEPKPGVLTTAAEREVARMWIERKALTVAEALEAMETFQQQGLLQRKDESITTATVDENDAKAKSLTTLIAPFTEFTDDAPASA
jgi:hypothetical protein